MIEVVISRNFSKCLRNFHQKIVVTSGVSSIFMKNVKIQSSASNAEGRLRSQKPMWDVGGQNGTRKNFLLSVYVDFPKSISFHHGNIITLQSSTIDYT